MKFAHFSDCHIGHWSSSGEKIGKLGILAFNTVIDDSINKKADFILIAGDLFDSAFPDFDRLNEVVIALFRKLKSSGISCYVIPGSHDFSASGKTMLNILENAGLLINVCKREVENDKLRLKFTLDEKTGAKITGMLGKKNALDIKYYGELDREALEKEDGFKIFMFHNALSELKMKNEKGDSMPISLLPKGFDYYAGGHVHCKENIISIGEYKNISYPGPLFPNSFKEIEELKNGGYYFYDDGKITWNPVKIVDVVSMNFNCNHKTPDQVEKEILQKIKETDVENKIVTMRVEGELSSGKPFDIKFNEIFGILYHKRAYFVMKSTSMVKVREFEKIQTNASSIEEAEEKIIRENSGQTDMKNESELIKILMKVFSNEKHEGETRHDFEKRLIEDVNKTLDID